MTHHINSQGEKISIEVATSEALEGQILRDFAAG